MAARTPNTAVVRPVETPTTLGATDLDRADRPVKLRLLSPRINGRSCSRAPDKVVPSKIRSVDLCLDVCGEPSPFPIAAAAADSPHLPVTLIAAAQGFHYGERQAFGGRSVEH